MITVKIPKVSSVLVIVVIAVVAFIFARPKPVEFNWNGYAGYHLSFSQVVDNSSTPLVLETSLYVRRVAGSTTPIIEGKIKDLYLSGSSVENMDNRSFDGMVNIEFDENGAIKQISLPEDLNSELKEIFVSSFSAIETVLVPGGGGRWRSTTDSGGVCDYILVALSKIEKRRVSLPDTAVVVNSSKFLASITGTFWLESIEGGESLLIAGSDGQSHRYDTKIKLKTIPFKEF
ncbi:MAG: hypothetical protein LBV09_06230 [Deferribacteraceae bacterium]|jgi:hypothetical protein|nr:hypothetical protein [Deferribacteraceae bacterium]